jgi:septin family protein
MIPFAVVGSEKTIVVGGRQVRGRQNRWGVVNGISQTSNILYDSTNEANS